tara:strand:+ start:1340 stop:1774 length:435 start_codon:yes stop_codon:yes gene_type:complete
MIHDHLLHILGKLLNKIIGAKEVNNMPNLETPENLENNKPDTPTSGFLPPELSKLVEETLGTPSRDFLMKWSEVTQKSLSANKYAFKNGLMTQGDHIICRFCDDGIPNWKNENAREHTSECPMTKIEDALDSMKELYKLALEAV